MILLPAIDLYKGKVVRLTKGDPEQSKVYSDDPVAIAKDLEAKGAEYIHIVDLSAALCEGDNLQIIKDILKQARVKIQVGGGIRSIEKAKELIASGVERIIIGTKGLDEDFLNELIKEVGREKIAVGVDVIDSCMAVEGWKKRTDFNGIDFIAYLQLKGIKWIIYTDISRDGTLSGVNYKEIEKLALYKDLNIILAGGISCIEDLKKINEKAPFIWGVISGKAIYESKLDLAQAIKQLKG